MLTVRNSPFGTFALLFCSATLIGCYTELEDPEEDYSGVVVNTDPRAPNTSVPTTTGTDPAPTAAPTATATTPPTATSTPPTATATTPPTATATTPPTATSTAPPPSYVPTPGCEDVVGTIFSSEAKCSGAACHGGAIFLNLSDPSGMGARLMDKDSVFCPTTKYIDSEDPMASTIVSKLSDTPCSGSQMPPSTSTASVTPEEKACIIEWVTAVADGHIVLQ